MELFPKTAIRSFRFVIFCLLVSLVLVACRKAQTIADLDHWEASVRGDNSPYLQTTSERGVKVSLRYLPVELLMIGDYREYLAQKENVSLSSQSSKQQSDAMLRALASRLRQRKESYQQYLHFQLTLAYEEPQKNIVYDQMKGGQEEYSRWLQKLAFGLQEQISLQTSAIDEVPLEVYQMEPTFGMNKNASFLLAFPSKVNGSDVLGPENQWLKIKIRDFGLSTGALSFEYKLPLKSFRYQDEF